MNKDLWTTSNKMANKMDFYIFA